ncbi:peptidoglycan DD-metalloendopeptidase family protein [Winogradskyella luteola]|uniref:Peptidoglycan DD-metalloendopeptidase family protein n=1 Tax=Winogradskyella luteola TaxID=2828330 RepID=A0A9X1JM53_9FLAO|nr:peptidoglycan DD-metalloendopeptidase family protein [Winogradskyella luteola]MBV7267926.1 peptidoglycan DD-metalloendopeptidase family protein [Winogradskyella luteola]
MPLSIFEAILCALNTHPILNVPKSDYTFLDLSIHNSELNNINVASSKDLEAYIFNHIEKNNAKAAFGGYLEHRGIYKRSTYFNEQNPKIERDIHLGLDLWIEANTSVFSPLDGKIHSFKNNTNYGDYGPTIILQHQIDAFGFYSLYGHLSLESIENLKIGAYVKQGQQIASLGTAKVNGDYPPHLHFQIIKDIQDYEGDYPGVSNQLDLEFYKVNCPDPNLLLGLG